MKEKTATKPRARSRPKSRTSKNGGAAPTEKTETRASTDAAEPYSDAAGSERERIELTAYFIYQERIAHGIPGDEFSDWLAAEAEVLAGAEALLSA